METPPDELDNPSLPIPEEISFSDTFHRYEDAPKISYKDVTNHVEQVEFDAISPEVDNHNNRKYKLGFRDYINTDPRIKKQTDFIRSKKETSSSRSSQRKSTMRTSPLRSSIKKNDTPLKSESSRDRENKTANHSPINGKVSYFKSNIYERKRKSPGRNHDVSSNKSSQIQKRPQSVRKGYLEKLKKPRIPSERKKRDVRRYNVEEMMKSRLTVASRDGRSTMKSTGNVQNQSPEPKMNRLLQIHKKSASKGRLANNSVYKKAIKPLKKRQKPKEKVKKASKKMNKPTNKRQKSVPKTIRRILSPTRSVVVYDYNKTGHQIIKQETVHEYKERMVNQLLNYFSSKIKMLFQNLISCLIINPSIF